MIQKIDETLTRVIFKFLNNNKNIAQIPYYLGLIPYELYVLPGMFIAISTMIYYETYIPLQFHLLPHWFAFSMATYIKHTIHRKRPGCQFPEMKGKIATNHCKMPTQVQSFPSGHTIIAFSLATTLLMFLNDISVPDENKKFIGIPFYDSRVRKIIEVLAIFIAAMTGIHRIGFGYHFFGDVLIGALLGMFIGYTSYKMFNIARYECSRLTVSEDEKQNDKYKKLAIKITSGIALALCGIALYDFFINKLGKLTQLKH